MLYIAALAAAFLVPAPVPVVVERPAPAVRAASVLVGDANSLLFPTTSSLSGGLLESSKSVDVYSGATEELTLSELLNSIPASDLDLQGEKGMVRDQVGISKMKKREAVAEIAAAKKYEEVIAQEAMEAMQMQRKT